MGATAFVNITREHLLGELYKIFDPTAVVLELLETVDGDAAVVNARARAVAEGYRLALDDYDGRASHDPLTTRDSREWWVMSSSFGSGVTRNPLLPTPVLPTPPLLRNPLCNARVHRIRLVLRHR